MFPYSYQTLQTFTTEKYIFKTVYHATMNLRNFQFSSLTCRSPFCKVTTDEEAYNLTSKSLPLFLTWVFFMQTYMATKQEVTSPSNLVQLPVGQMGKNLLLT